MTSIYPLSERQERILSYVKSYTSDHAYGPGVRDIMEGCNISSTSVVVYNLDALERRGLLTRDRDVARSIRVVKALDSCPFCGCDGGHA